MQKVIMAHLLFSWKLILNAKWMNKWAQHCVCAAYRNAKSNEPIFPLISAKIHHNSKAPHSVSVCVRVTNQSENRDDNDSEKMHT